MMMKNESFALVFICLISEGCAMRLNRELEETLTDDEEFELFKDLVVEMENNETEAVTILPPAADDQSKEEYDEDAFNFKEEEIEEVIDIVVVNEEEGEESIISDTTDEPEIEIEEALVDDIIDELGDDLVEIVSNRGDNAAGEQINGAVYIAVGVASGLSVVVVAAIIGLLVLKFKNNSIDNQQAANPRNNS